MKIKMDNSFYVEFIVNDLM